jgi:hypothetical protein
MPGSGTSRPGVPMPYRMACDRACWPEIDQVPVSVLSLSRKIAQSGESWPSPDLKPIAMLS